MYAVFCGNIDQDSAKAVSNLLAAVSFDGPERLHLLFQSTGGFISEGIYLHNLFRSLPYDLWIYNAGQVSSIAALAFLGAKHRIVEKHARFLFHRATQNVQLGTVEQLETVVDSLTKDNARVEDILRANLTLTDELWEKHKTTDLVLTAEEGVSCGAANSFGAFEVPIGAKLLRPMQS